MSDAIETKLALIEQRQSNHEEVHTEFRKAINDRLTKQDTKLDLLIAQNTQTREQFREWSGVRKALYGVAGVLVTIATFIGWVFHEVITSSIKIH